MKPKLTLMLAMLTSAIVIGMFTVSIQQVYAPRGCNGCVAFKKLTNELEKNVIEASNSRRPQYHTWLT